MWCRLWFRFWFRFGFGHGFGLGFGVGVCYVFGFGVDFSCDFDSALVRFRFLYEFSPPPPTSLSPAGWSYMYYVDVAAICSHAVVRVGGPLRFCLCCRAEQSHPSRPLWSLGDRACAASQGRRVRESRNDLHMGGCESDPAGAERGRRDGTQTAPRSARDDQAPSLGKLRHDQHTCKLACLFWSLTSARP